MRITLPAFLAVFTTLACGSTNDQQLVPDGGIDSGINSETGGETGSGTCGAEGTPCCLIGTSCASPLVCEGGSCKKVANTETGKTCFADSECLSGVCITIGSSTQKVCSTPCSSTTSCVRGWSCTTQSGRPTQVCECYRSTEQCDGMDNDCDGVIDDNASSSCASSLGPGATCVAGQCRCASGAASCGGQCVDTNTDIYNCGGCNRDCYGSGQTCSGGVCRCSNTTLTACESSCVNTQTDPYNCGTCGTTCNSPSTCVAGQCKCANTTDSLCSGSCVNTTTSSTNCGTCGRTCAGPCSASVCTNAVQISSRANHTCARLTDGSVRCWGLNTNGQIGDGFTSTRYEPVPVGTITVAEVVAGETHTCARLTDGSVQCWGSNSSGQIGDGGSTGNRLTPSTVSISGVTQIAAGAYHTCARTSSGILWCWGYNGNYQLGDSSGTSYRYTPYQVTSLSGVVEVAAGRDHTCARLTDGSVKCFGSNSAGQLGYGSTSTSAQYTPQTVVSSTTLSPISGAVQLVAGPTHTCARMSDTTVRCWGANGNYQLGSTSGTGYAAITVPSVSGVTALASGGTHVCAIASGALWCWGNNSSGQFGTGSTGSSANTPMQLSNVVSPLEIAAGTAHTCVRTADAVRCMGAGSNGQIGDNAGSSRYTPTLVTW